MCGIMGYVGGKPASNILLDGLKRLEYRGYDSAGIAIVQNDKVEVERAKGKLSVLANKVKEKNLFGTSGIGHTRWATHGRPSDENAHPHRGVNVVAVHNGIIENHIELRDMLTKEGFEFQSETDTEVFPFLIEHFLEESKDLEEAVRKAVAKLKGAFAFAVLSSADPDRIIAVKNSSPLILGLGEDEAFLASDIPALLSHTRNVVILEDGDMAVLKKDSYVVTDFQGNPLERKPRHVEWSRVMAEKEGYKHFMLKEIHEQPVAIADTLRGRLLESSGEIVLDDIRLSKSEIEKLRRITILACGTSYHAALVGKYWIEELARIPVDVDLGSEYRYRNPVIHDEMIGIAISQSGETADTLAAIELAKEEGMKIFSICNVVDSTIARRSDYTLYTHAGPEIGVASTKAFTTQLVALALMAIHFAHQRGVLPEKDIRNLLHELVKVPQRVEEALKFGEKILEITPEISQAQHALFLGRGSSYPIALEGALKLKEISYIHAEGYAGGEMKHGPIALVDDDMPIIALASGGRSYAKIVSNLEETKARGGQVTAIISEDDEELEKYVKNVIRVPRVGNFIRPIIEVIPLQMLAYYVADHRGTDVDQPRNLAKSVTVE